MSQFDIVILAMQAAREKIDKDGGLKPLMSRRVKGIDFEIDMSKVMFCVEEDLCSMTVTTLIGLLGISRPIIHSIRNSTYSDISEKTKNKLLKRYGERILR